MDGQTLGAAIAICGEQIKEQIEGIIGEIDGMLVSVENHKLVLTEKDGDNNG